DLAGLAERRSVKRRDDGTFSSDDGLEPGTLDPDSLVSMNLWGFQPEIWGFLEAAVRRDHPEVAPNGALAEDIGDDAGGAGGGAAASSGGPKDPAETLLPEVVGDAVHAGSLEATVAQGSGRWVGVAHAADLPVARAELARMIGRGERAEPLWQSSH